MKDKILNEVAASKWQPQFRFTDDLDEVVDSILKPHEDYFLKLHDKVKEIIQREISQAPCKGVVDFFDELGNEIQPKCRVCGSNTNSTWCDSLGNYNINFSDLCNWQKELFEYKLEKVKEHNRYDLPNLYINLGLRKVNVKVGNWTPPSPIFLEELKDMCFPLDLWVNLIDNGLSYDEEVLAKLLEWYKIFETIHFFEDLNGRLGGIAVNIMSYLLTGKYISLSS